MTAAYEGKLIASTKKDPVFLTKGFTYWKRDWKEATTAFKKHEASQLVSRGNKRSYRSASQAGE